MTLKEPQKKLTERLNETRKIIQKNIAELVEKSTMRKNTEKHIQALQANIEKAIKLSLLGLNVATRDQIDFLNKRIELLNEKLEDYAKGEKGKKKGGKKSKKAAE